MQQDIPTGSLVALDRSLDDPINVDSQRLQPFEIEFRVLGVGVGVQAHKCVYIYIYVPGTGIDGLALKASATAGDL